MLNTALKQTSLPDDEQLISCETCINSVPISETNIVEVEEYVAYFCGLECYDQWLHQKPPHNPVK